MYISMDKGQNGKRMKNIKTISLLMYCNYTPNGKFLFKIKVKQIHSDCMFPRYCE